MTTKPIKTSILIVEDVLAQAQILQYNLEAEGFAVTHAPYGGHRGVPSN